VANGARRSARRRLCSSSASAPRRPFARLTRAQRPLDAGLLVSIPLCSTPKFKDTDFLRQKYIEEGLFANEIAKEISSSRSTVLKYLRHFGIPLRPRDEKNKSRAGFGEAWRKHQLLLHRREQGIIEKMQSLCAEGLSYAKIADVLNAWGIPTKTRKGKWSGKQVHQILIRIEKTRESGTKG
jgi:hypothetical protein